MNEFRLLPGMTLDTGRVYTGPPSTLVEGEQGMTRTDIDNLKMISQVIYVPETGGKEFNNTKVNEAFKEVTGGGNEVALAELAKMAMATSADAFWYPGEKEWMMSAEVPDMGFPLEDKGDPIIGGVIGILWSLLIGSVSVTTAVASLLALIFGWAIGGIGGGGGAKAIYAGNKLVGGVEGEIAEGFLRGAKGRLRSIDAGVTAGKVEIRR